MSPPRGYHTKYVGSRADGLTPPCLCTDFSACRTILKLRCISWPSKLTQPFPETWPRSRTPLPTPESYTYICQKLHPSNYTTGSQPVMFSWRSIKIACIMATIHFTSRSSPPKRCGSASNRGDPSRTWSTRNTPRRCLQKSNCTPQCQWSPFHRSLLIQLQQRHSTRIRCSSILWHNRCTKMRHWWRSSSTKPPQWPLKCHYNKTTISSVPPFQNGMGRQTPSRYYWRNWMITRPKPITPTSLTGHRWYQWPGNWASHYNGHAIETTFGPVFHVS